MANRSFKWLFCWSRSNFSIADHWSYFFSFSDTDTDTNTGSIKIKVGISVSRVVVLFVIIIIGVWWRYFKKWIQAFKTDWLALVFLWNGAHIPLDWKCVRADHPSIYLTLKVLKGVCLSFKKFHVYSQFSISRRKANEEFFCARPLIFSHLYCYKMISRAICIQSARVYLAKIITEKNVAVRRLSRAYPKVNTSLCFNFWTRFQFYDRLGISLHSLSHWICWNFRNNCIINDNYWINDQNFCLSLSSIPWMRNLLIPFKP